jgi:hypothetical protein
MLNFKGGDGQEHIFGTYKLKMLLISNGISQDNVPKPEEMIDELHSVFATLSRVFYEISQPEGCKWLKMNLLLKHYQNILNSQSQRKAVDVCSGITISGKVSVTTTTEASTLLR